MIKQSKKNSKPVTIIARYFIKRTGAIVYAVRSSNGVDQYCTTVINGKATGCSCPSRKPCRHMAHCESVESERQQAATQNIEMVMTRRSTAPVALDIVRTFKAEDAYEQLAESKDPWAGLTEDQKVTAMGYYLMGIGA